MLKWSFAAGRWLAQIAFGVSGGFFLIWLLNGTNRGMSSLSVYSLGLSKKKKDVAFFFVHSEHSYYNYFHTFSIRKRGFFFFSNSDPL